MQSNDFDIVTAIRSEAARMGFAACGIASANEVSGHVYKRWQEWIAQGKHATMEYMERYATVRLNPQELLPHANSIISVALNYYPGIKIPKHNPRFAYYAYGVDYHDVMREKLHRLATYINSIASCDYRVCCDTAPIFERYWAAQSGVGFVGRNSQLIIPGQGSYFFLGEVLTTLELPPSQPILHNCGDCRRCIDACPVDAITDDGMIDARRCISCQTIENRKDISPEVASRLGRRVYGCDTCQEVCPHNRYATPHHTDELQPSQDILSLSYNRLCNLSRKAFNDIFRHSAVKRVKYEGLMRNVSLLDASQFEE